jgi:hypothetical protein
MSLRPHHQGTTCAPPGLQLESTHIRLTRNCQASPTLPQTSPRSSTPHDAPPQFPSLCRTWELGRTASVNSFLAGLAEHNDATLKRDSCATQQPRSRLAPCLAGCHEPELGPAARLPPCLSQRDRGESGDQDLDSPNGNFQLDLPGAESVQRRYGLDRRDAGSVDRRMGISVAMG